VADGNLYITAMEDGSGGYTSGRINTKQTAGFHPGMQVGGAGMGCAGGKGRVGWVKEAMQEGRGAFVCWRRAPQSAGRRQLSHPQSCAHGVSPQNKQSCLTVQFSGLPVTPPPRPPPAAAEGWHYLLKRAHRGAHAAAAARPGPLARLLAFPHRLDLWKVGCQWGD
jgi:hypothetical protein